jgi:hypothetical protein
VGYFNSKCARALTFENGFQALKSSPNPYHTPRRGGGGGGLGGGSAGEGMANWEVGGGRRKGGGGRGEGGESEEENVLSDAEMQFSGTCALFFFYLFLNC